MTTKSPKPSPLVEHARVELERAGYPEEEATPILSVVQAYADTGQSGGSHEHTLALLEELLNFRPLTPLTNDPEEWQHIEEDKAGRGDLWQSRRNPEAFSHDEGVTHYLLSQREHGVDVYQVTQVADPNRPGAQVVESADDAKGSE